MSMPDDAVRETQTYADLTCDETGYAWDCDLPYADELGNYDELDDEDG